MVSSFPEVVAKAQAARSKAQIRMHEVLNAAGLAAETYRINSDGSVLIAGTLYCDTEGEQGVFRLNEDAMVISFARQVDCLHVWCSKGFLAESIPATELRAFLLSLAEHEPQ